MNLIVEESLRAWLRDLPEFDGLAIHLGQSNDEIPGDQPALVCACERVEPVTLALSKAFPTLLLSTPSMLDLEQHRALVDHLRAAVYDPTDLAAAFPSDFHLAGAILTDFSESQTDSRWLCTATLTLGIAAI
jgi:hypothetical protein